MIGAVVLCAHCPFKASEEMVCTMYLQWYATVHQTEVS